MNKKKQMTQANNSSDNMAEISDKDLQQVVGGIDLSGVRYALWLGARRLREAAQVVIPPNPFSWPGL